MTALLRVELTRLVWRRAVLALGVGCVLLTGLIFAVVVVQSGGSSDDVYPSFDAGFYPQSGLDLAEQLRDTLPAVGALVGVLVVLAGITFAGHDWATGSLGNQLLVEPRRMRVWSAKAVVLLVVGLLAALVVQAAYWSGMWLVAKLHGNATHAAVVAGYQEVLRVSILIALAGVGGYALTMLLRSTVGSLGTLVGLTVALPLLVSQLAFPVSAQLAPQDNVTAIVTNGAEFIHYDYGSFDDYSNDTRSTVEISQLEGWVYAGVVLLLVGAASAVSFQRRDVP